MSRTADSPLIPAMCLRHGARSRCFTRASSSSSVTATSPTSGTSTFTVLSISDGSISAWIFFAPVAKVLVLPVTRSSKRIPSATIRSDCCTAKLTHASPCMPIIPSDNGCVAGKPPRPSSVCATGMSARSASSRRAFVAPAIITPCPARMTGRFAASINSAALSSRSTRAPRRFPLRGRRGGASAGASTVACCASLVMSISTGPGRPDRATWNASRTVAGMSCALVTR